MGSEADARSCSSTTETPGRPGVGGPGWRHRGEHVEIFACLQCTCSPVRQARKQASVASCPHIQSNGYIHLRLVA